MKSPYYTNTSNRIASALSVRAREKMFARFMDVMHPSRKASVLDVGVTSDTSRPESNYFERLYPWKNSITCVGTEDGSHLARFGVKFIPVRPGGRLPFRDNEFDVAFSSATIEHVGGFIEQEMFIAEISRVSRSLFITTPNRWCPMEFHTSIPLIHMLPRCIHRTVLSAIGMKYWSNEWNLNLLSKSDLFRIHPALTVEPISIFGINTNLIAYKT